MESTKFQHFLFHLTLYDNPNDFQINNKNIQIRFELNFDIGYQKSASQKREKEQWWWHHFHQCVTYVERKKYRIKRRRRSTVTNEMIVVKIVSIELLYNYAILLFIECSMFNVQCSMHSLCILWLLLLILAFLNELLLFIMGFYADHT